MYYNWPAEKDIMPYKKPSTVKEIELLFYHTGVTVSAIYVFIHLVLSRVLSKNYDQRLELSHDVLMRIRRLVNSLMSRVKSTSVTAVGDNQRSIQETKVYVDRCQQTGEQLESVDENAGWTRINLRLNTLTDVLRIYHTDMRNISDFESLSFKTKLFTDQLKDSSWRNKKQEGYSNIIQSVREMKGWFIHGRIPKG